MSRPRAALIALIALTVAACSAGPATQPTAIDKITMPPVTAAPTVTHVVATPTAAVTPVPIAEPPSPISQPTPKPTARPTPTPRSTPGPFRDGMMGSVLSDTLRVRSKPGISDDSIKYEPLLKKGTHSTTSTARVPRRATSGTWWTSAAMATRRCATA